MEKLNKLKNLIQEKSILKHPFYKAWSAGLLSREDLRRYTCQYYHHVLQFPTYVSGAHANCDDLPDRQELLENLVEEEQGPNNHPELWLRFGEALGLTREEIIDSSPLPETTGLITTYRRLTKDSPFIGGIAALYAYESQVPEVAGTKIAGLKQFYGIDDPQELKFFIVHHSLDVEHSKVTRNLVAKYGDTAEAEDEAFSAVDEATTALNTFLDGVCREYLPTGQAGVAA